MTSKHGPIDKDRLKSLYEYYRSVEMSSYHESWIDFLPRSPGTALDIGAGSGRDADWLSKRGWKVTAVEPNPQWARLQKVNKSIEWVSDTLPNLLALFSKPQYDLVLVSNVWPSLSRIEQQQSLIRLFGLVKEFGILVITWSSADVDLDHVDQLTLQNALIIESDDRLNKGEKQMVAVFSSKALSPEVEA